MPPSSATDAVSTTMRVSVLPGSRASPVQASRSAALIASTPAARPRRPSSSWRLLVGDAPVEQRDRAIGARGDAGVVRREDERKADLVLQRRDQVEHAGTRVGVELTGRLVA